MIWDIAINYWAKGSYDTDPKENDQQTAVHSQDWEN